MKTLPHMSLSTLSAEKHVRHSHSASSHLIARAAALRAMHSSINHERLDDCVNTEDASATSSGNETDTSASQSTSLSSPSSAPFQQYMCGYIYVSVASPRDIRTELTEQLASVGATGRIYVYRNGINVQLTAPPEAIPDCDRIIHEVGNQVFKDIRLFPGEVLDMARVAPPFSALVIRVRPLLREGLPQEYSDSLDPYMSGLLHLSPESWHKEIIAAERAKQRFISQQKYAQQHQQQHQHNPQQDKSRTALPNATAADADAESVQQSQPSLPPLIFDVRNQYEHEIGGFNGAIPILVDTFRDSFEELDRMLGVHLRSEQQQVQQQQHEHEQEQELQSAVSAVNDHNISSTPDDIATTTSPAHTRSPILISKPSMAVPPPDVRAEAEAMIPTPPRPVEADRKLLLYCTGGIRCLKVGAFLRSRGFTDVNVLEGGVNAYAKYAQEKLLPAQEPSTFRGANMVFDNRVVMRVTDDVVSRCHHCGEECDRLRNCDLHKCDLLMVQCERCATAYRGCCSAACATEQHNLPVMRELLGENMQVVAHPPPKTRIRPRLVPITRPVHGDIPV